MDDQVVQTDSNFSERVPQPFERIDNFSEQMAQAVRTDG